jgi:hypothetical protein
MRLIPPSRQGWSRMAAWWVLLSLLVAARMVLRMLCWITRWVGGEVYWLNSWCFAICSFG